MARARKTRARTRAPARARTRRKAKQRPRIASKTTRRKARPGKGVVAKMKDAATAVAETLEESRAMARKAGSRGGLSEG